MRRSHVPGPLFVSLLAAVACGDDGSADLDSTGAGEQATSTAATPTSGAAPTSGSTQASESAGDATASASTTSTGDVTTSASTTGSSTDAAPTTGPSTGTSEGGRDDFCSPPGVGTDDVPLNEACDVSLQVGSFEPVIEWKFGDGGFFGPPVVGQTIDTNGSGALDAGDLPHVFLYEYDEVVAVRGDGSGVAWMTDGKYAVEASGGLALGDLEGDGWNEIVSAVKMRVCVLDGRDGAEKWCVDVPPDNCDVNGYHGPSIADLDGDGTAEVILGSAILDASGGILALGALGHGGAPFKGDPLKGSYGDLSAAVDLDADGVLELVTGNAAYDLDGNPVWSNGSIDGLVAVADFDHDGAGEIVKTSGIHVFGMESDGSIAWGPVTHAEARIGPPAIDDLDGDGTPEIVYGARNELVALEWGGAKMWTAALDDFSGAAGPVLFDFERDGYPEVLYAGEMAVRFFSGIDGSVKFLGGKHISSTGLETPIVADVDGDDHVEIVVAHSSGTISHGSISAYGDAGNTWPPGRKIWNQHGYHITNIGDLGEVPTEYQPNWLPGFNSFRSGDTGQQPGKYHDLTIEILGVCEEQCAAGTFFMAARPRNAGNVEAPAGLPVTVRAGPGGDIVATLATTAPVPPGKTGEVLFFEFAAGDLAQTQPVITIDDTGLGTGALFECAEDNNTATWPLAVCPDVDPS